MLKHLRGTCFLFVLSLVSLTSNAQQALDNNPLFDDQSIPEIFISIHPDSLAEILDPANEESYHAFPATFVFDNGSMRDTVENVGFRLRGNTSRHSAKKSFKVAFNSFEQGRKYYGLEKLNLNGEHNDPSIVRAKLAWDIFNDLGIPSSRSNHIKLFINDVYRGLYINVEHIDENFIRDHFGNNDGNLYKCLWPADLTYLGEDPNLYKFKNGNRRTYALKTNEEADNYSDLAELIRVLDQTSEDQFPAAIEAIFNVNSFLRILAADVATGNWDNYWYNKNNYYLYHDTETGKFNFIPYDYDNTFGIDWVGKNWGNRSIYDWGDDNESRPLTNRILAVQTFRDRFSFFLQKLLKNQFAPADLLPKIDALHTQISAAAEADTFRSLDWGYTVDDFHNSYSGPLDGHVDYGLKPYISTRYGAALGQLVLNDIAPIVTNIISSPAFPDENDLIEIRFSAEDEDESLSAQLHCFIDDVAQNPVSFSSAGGETYVANLPVTNASGRISYFISVEDEGGHTVLAPENAPNNLFRIHNAHQIEGLVINEFLASNDTTNVDDFGEYEDWVEVYNGDSVAVWLGDKYLTDNLENLDKWALPDTTLQPGEFLLIWCDKDADQGELHASFKLSAGGEQLGISATTDNGLVFIDSLTFGEQTTDQSFGRTQDGSSAWQFFTTPTPNSANQPMASSQEKNNLIMGAFTLNQNFPNPFRNQTTVRFAQENPAKVNLKIYNLVGQLVEQVLVDQVFSTGSHSVVLDLADLSAGVYFYQLSAGGNQITKMLTIIR